MAGAQGSALAISVSAAGGLGSLPAALLTPDQLRDEIGAIAARTSNPYNVNFFCHTPPAPDPERHDRWRALLEPYYRELGVEPPSGDAAAGRAPFDHDAADVLAALQPPVVSFHFGLPEKALLDRLRPWRPLIMSSATTIDEARWLEACGVDAIIAQGVEAGGHRGMFLSDDLTTQVGTLALVPQVARAVRVPVVAAGGVADADGVVAALALGAAAVQIGTAYLLCPEAATPPLHRAALRSHRSHQTALTNVFTGRSARSIVNRLIAEMGPINSAAPPFPLATAAIMPLRAKAEAEGRDDFSPLWAGQNATGCDEIPAGDLTTRLAARLG
jgi:nitronate monooxygenase